MILFIITLLVFEETLFYSEANIVKAEFLSGFRTGVWQPNNSISHSKILDNGDAIISGDFEYFGDNSSGSHLLNKSNSSENPFNTMISTSWIRPRIRTMITDG